jgi:tRNA/tmRNA/rRNA uracil-C5-methylase (TrmA/RlmC/RlmD family)
VSARSFFQSSAVAASALVDEVTRAGDEFLSGAHGPVVDAYGGVGLFARCAVGPEAPGVLLEGAPSSCADAQENLEGRAMTVVEGPVEEWDATPAAFVIADPARAGLGPVAAQRLAATGCDRLVLVSCDAAAGARDVRLLVDAGLHHVRSTVLDPFPHTAHVEVVTVLARSARDAAG